MNEPSEEYIRRMLTEAGRLVTKVVSLSAAVDQVDTDEVMDEYNDAKAEFIQALNNAMDEIHYV